MVFIVLAHYNESLYWVNNLKYKYTVISKAGIPSEQPPNRGNEASSYLEYIINNYDNLDDITVFIHAHRNHWHHLGNIDEKINNLVFNKSYYNINTNDTNNSLTELNNFSVELEKMQQLHPQLGEILGIKIEPEKIVYRNSAQFYVKRENIHRHSKDVYVKLYDWLMTSSETTFYTARAFEYIWHIIFTGEHVDVL